MVTSLSVLIVLYLFSVQMGCNREAEESPQSPNALTTKPATIADNECVEFARSIEAAILSGDAEAFNAEINHDAIVEAATASLHIPEELLAHFKQQVDSLHRSERGTASEVLKHVAAGGSYRFLRVREIDGKKTVLFRLISESGINYHEFLLDDIDGDIKATDVYVFLLGERLSESLRRFAQPLEQFNPDSSSTNDSSYVTHLDHIKAMGKHRREGRYNEVLRLYKELPEDLRQDKPMLMLRHQAAMSLGDDELREAVEDFRRFLPDDPCVMFLSIDYFMLNMQYKRALEAIDHLDASVGGDPYLDAIRADVAHKQGETAKAYQLAEAVIHELPDLAASYSMLIDIARQDRNFDRMLAGLEKLGEQFEVDPAALYDDPAYVEFFQSPQGKEWKQRHPHQ